MKHSKRIFTICLGVAILASMPRGRFTIVKLYLHDGRVLSERTDIPKGSPGRPLTRQELLAKLTMSLGEEQAKRIFETGGKEIEYFCTGNVRDAGK